MKQLLKRSLFLKGFIQACRQLPGDLRRLRWTGRRPGQIKSYLATSQVRKLQIGTGKNLLPGWLNTDYCPVRPGQVYLDATQPFPLPDSSFDCVFSEHVIEHLWYADGQTMLRECLRILRPGTKIRISTPNLLNIAGLLTDQKTDLQQRYLRLATDRYVPQNRDYRAAFVVNNFYWDFGHYFLYDPETLQAALEQAGFRNITRWTPGASDDPLLTGVEHHGEVIGPELNAFESMVLQGTRP